MNDSFNTGCSTNVAYPFKFKYVMYRPDILLVAGMISLSYDPCVSVGQICEKLNVLINDPCEAGGRICEDDYRTDPFSTYVYASKDEKAGVKYVKEVLNKSDPCVTGVEYHF